MGERRKWLHGVVRGWLGGAALHIRDALGIPTTHDCDVCGGLAWDVRTSEGETACIVCVDTERADIKHKLAKTRDELARTRLDLADATLRAKVAERERPR